MLEETDPAVAPSTTTSNSRTARDHASHHSVAWTPLPDLRALQRPPIYRQLIAVARR